MMTDILGKIRYVGRHFGKNLICWLVLKVGAIEKFLLLQ